MVRGPSLRFSTLNKILMWRARRSIHGTLSARQEIGDMTEAFRTAQDCEVALSFDCFIKNIWHDRESYSYLRVLSSVRHLVDRLFVPHSCPRWLVAIPWIEHDSSLERVRTCSGMLLHPSCLTLSEAWIWDEVN